MLNNTYHINTSKLHFSRWSNASFAIFHSIGREVMIGMVSTLLDNLVTVKSHFVSGFLKSSEDDFYEGEDLDEKFEQVTVDALLYEIFKADVTNIGLQSSVSESGTSKKHVVNFHIGSTLDLFLFAILYLPSKPNLYFTQNY